MDGGRQPRCDGAALWDLHFRDPARGFALAQAWVHDEGAGASARAWAALAIAFHHLFVTPRPEEAQSWLASARERFEKTGERAGMLLAQIGEARLAIVRRAILPARAALLALKPEALQTLRDVDRFWLANALAATFYYNDEVDEAIACLYEAFEALSAVAPSPHLPTAMSNLAAALVTVGDFAPARELAMQALALLPQYNNATVELYTRSNLAEAQLGLGDQAGAIATIDAMMGDPAASPRRASQNHYLGVAAEAYAACGRVAGAVRCAEAASEILADYPGAFNEVHAAWAHAMAVAARDGSEAAIAPLEAAARIAEGNGYLPVVCKANARLASLHAEAGRWQSAYEHSQRLLSGERARLAHRASAKYYLLRVRHELAGARAERDRALAQGAQTAALNRQLEAMNHELSRRMEEIEGLQRQLAMEATRDPLTQLFNRRHLDSVTPGLVAAALRRNAPLAVALVDFDHFKRINDRHGHPAGDLVLHEIGRLLGTALRPADVVCRYGGEEFCVVLPDTDVAGARIALASLAAKLRELAVDCDGETLTGFTFSAGVAGLPQHGSTFAALVIAADRALYDAKAAGRNCVIDAGPPAAGVGDAC
jgi:diguanylate cyclase (GGDEF)-like protein